MVSGNREKLSSHFWMQFWTRHFVVLLPCWLLVVVGNQLLLVYQSPELLLWGSVLFIHTDMVISDSYTDFCLDLIGRLSV